MATANEVVNEVAPENSTSDNGDKAKPKRKRTVTKYGKPGLELAEFTIPAGGLPDVPTEWTLFVHKELVRDQFADPMDYYLWLESQLLPQIQSEIDAQKASLGEVDSKEERLALQDVNVKLDEAADNFMKKLLDADNLSPKLIEAMQAKLTNVAGNLASAVAAQKAKADTPDASE